MFLRQLQRQRKCFLSERELRKALRDTLTRVAWLGPVIFDWFVLSMHMQVILGYLPFTQENRKFQLENQMVRAIPFGKLQKIWTVI